MVRLGWRATALAVSLGVAAWCGAAAAAEPPRVVFDFESGDLQGWQVVEGRFDLLVSDPRDVRNHQGRLLLTTLQRPNEAEKTDRMTGVVESPVFVLGGPDMSLRVGGGSHASTYVALCTLDGKEHLQARGKSSVVMQEVAWRTPELVGQKVFVRVVDRHEGGWGHVTFDDFRAIGTIDEPATAARRAAAERARQDAARREAAEAVRTTCGPLRAAVEDLAGTFGPRYPGAKGFLDRLADLERRLESASPDALKALGEELRTLEREALVASPLVSGQPILFVVRQQYRPDHHNTETMFQTGEINTGSFTGGGALKTIDFARGGEVKTLLELAKGVARDPEVSFDGTKILFAMRRDVQDDYHLYETSADGTGLRQLTFLPGVTDIDPLYLPDGRIAFTSTREPKYCMCNRHIMGNLFRMDGDGANIHQIGHSTLHEGHGALTPEGTILYDRWEYVDRNFGDAQGAWTCNPDGTNHAIYYGNNTPSPGAVLDSRAIPGTDRFVANFSSCHDRPWGALAIVDRSRGIDGKNPVVQTWPADAIRLVMQGGYDAFTSVKPKYEDPFPLGDPAAPASAGKYFLCSRQMTGEQMGLFLVDVFGNEVLLHAEAPGCYDPMPLGPHTRPPVVPDRIRLGQKEGCFYVRDVYVGTGMERVKRGAVKFLRVVESPEKRFWTNPDWQGSGTQAPAMAWDDFNNKRILGTVPVEEDGSAYFAVPADRFVYFQLLDADGMMIQSMRSGTIARPGETAGCAGCHEDRRSTVPNEPRKAMTRAPSRLVPWHGEERLFNYLAEVQPVFDKYCVRCHDFGKPAAKKVILAGDLTRSFNVSYMELRRKGLVRVVGAGPPEVQMPYSWGARASRLVEVIRKGKGDMRIDAESLDRVVTWIDINAPYYPSYASSYPQNLYGRCPLDNQQLGALGKLVGKDVVGEPHEIMITFTRPELSPCLAALKDAGDPKYRDALAIIEAGKAMLAKRPRMDMPGSRLEGIEAEREAKYQRLAAQESAAREAILAGRKVYDAAPPAP